MKKLLLLLAADATGGGGPAKETPEQTIARLTAENQKLNAAVAAASEADKERKAEELLIAEKVGKGLTRDQAIAVIKRQKDHDKALADKRAARLPALQQIIKNNPDEVKARAVGRAKFQDLDGSEFSDAIASVKK